MLAEALQPNAFGTFNPRMYFRALAPPRDTESDGPRLLNMREAAEMLRVNKTTLYTHFIHTRRLATIQIGRRRLVPLEAVRELIESLRADGAQ
ncbi:helix-turn-helix domain-containing protein [Streptomyces sp. NPDC050548]|uniref:helix-turn-helix domain-containing protein n=1 Tax=Streptomyces sp. NPDC050548 TaxID=3365629 RepID=UPI00379D954B